MLAAHIIFIIVIVPVPETSVLTSGGVKLGEGNWEADC